jgi:CPA2 family monovalent cation:H+ antiporter-2
MQMDPFLPRLVAGLWVVVVLAVLGRRVAQPMPVIYLIAGIALGPFGVGLLEDTEAMGRLGEYGVILLLFLLGTEIDLGQLLAKWKVPVLGLVFQVAASVAAAAAIGAALDWSAGLVVLVGFSISLSSTAVVLRLIESRNLRGTPLGSDVLAVLLAQDLALAPMLVILGTFGGAGIEAHVLVPQLAAGLGLLGLVMAVQWKLIRPRVPAFLLADPELEVLIALLIALTFAMVSAAAGLSSAFGAFVAGVVIASTQQDDWVHDSLHPFRVVLVAVFLMAIGTLLDLHFLWEHLGLISMLAAAALVTNTLLNGAILRGLGSSWSNALLGGALLSQIGEFSFVLAAVGRQAGLIDAFGYQLALAVIATTLLLSAAWITLVSAILPKDEPASDPIRTAS